MGICFRGAFPPVDIRAVCLVRRGGIPPVNIRAVFLGRCGEANANLVDILVVGELLGRYLHTIN